MYNTVQNDATFFLICILVGLLTAFLYDIIRISRRLVKVGTSAVTVQDIFFFAFFAVALFYAAYIKNSGEVRWQGFIGAIAGVCLYAALVRNRFVNLGTFLLKWLINSAFKFMRIILFPLTLLMRALRKPVEIVAWYTSKTLQKATRISKTHRAKAKMRLKAALLMARKK